MPKLSALRGNGLANQTAMYEQHLNLAGPFLEARGIGPKTARRYRLGYVAEPCSGHEPAQGFLSIPYLTVSGVVALRFRNTDPASDFRYFQPKGSGTWLYNVSRLLDSPPFVALCEGELDTITVDGLAGIPAVGIAGTQAWRPEFASLFEMVETVLVVADGGDAGGEMVEMVCKQVPNARGAQMPDELDCNEFLLQNGVDELAERIVSFL